MFINFHMRGYNKLGDVHFGLSENELLIEIKEPSPSLTNHSGVKVHRLCKTLFREVDVDQSSIELLVDFVAVKLRKRDKDVTWD